MYSAFKWGTTGATGITGIYNYRLNKCEANMAAFLVAVRVVTPSTRVSAVGAANQFLTGAVDGASVSVEVGRGVEYHFTDFTNIDFCMGRG